MIEEPGALNTSIKNIFTLILFILPALSFGQWVYMGDIDNPLNAAFASEDTIYEFTNEVHTPSWGTKGTVYGHKEELYVTDYYLGCCPMGDLVFTSKDTGILVYYSYGNVVIQQTNDGGHHWISPECSPIYRNEYSIQYLSPDVSFSIGDIYGSGQGIFSRCVEGHGVDTLRVPIHCDDHSKIYFINRYVGFIIGMDTTNTLLLLRTSDMGNSWKTVMKGKPNYYHCIHFPSINHGFIAGDSGRIYTTYNNGITWARSVIDTSITWKDIFFLNDSTGYVVGTKGNVYYTEDGGFTWVKQQIATDHDLVRVVFVSKSVGFICSYLWEYPTNDNYVGELFKLNLNPADSQHHPELYIVPNPSSGIFSVEIPKEFLFDKLLTVKVYDKTGRLVQDQSITSFYKNISVDLTKKSAGLYLITLSNGTKDYKGKLAKK